MADKKRKVSPYRRCPDPECRSSRVFKLNKSRWACEKCGLSWTSTGKQYEPPECDGDS